MPSNIDPERLVKLMKDAKNMSPLEKELQKVSFVWGNLPNTNKRTKLDVASHLFETGAISREALSTIEAETQYLLRLQGKDNSWK